MSGIRRRLLYAKQKESLYPEEGLVLWLDAILQNKKYPTLNGWFDFVSKESINTTTAAWRKASTYISGYRAGGYLPDTLISELNNFSIEVIFQRKGYSWDGTIVTTSDADNNHLFAIKSVGSNSPFSIITIGGQFRVYGSNTKYGTALSEVNNIVHYTLVYNGNRYIMYHDGSKDIEINGGFNIPIERLCYFGYPPYANYTCASFNGLRIYSRALTQDEVTSNYNIDIERFGTENVL